MNSQHEKIRRLLADGNFHCTSEMRALYMADPPKRLQELGREVVCGGRCALHNYHIGGVKMWRLSNLPKPDYSGIKSPVVREFLIKYPSKQQVKEMTLF